ncbi:hypothetical protein ACIA8C_12990 [Nocardia sp. NPDC051321]|uniref:hypothetical protein n=1 Tax=Nocardia sp. NPDC051321 TaxID=3364323 RepID=UPI0037A46CEB
MRTETSRTPALPVTRPTGCPFDPPAEYAALRDTEPVRAVRCPTGIDAWLVTRYDDVRAVLADRTMSSRGAASVHILPNAGLDEVLPGSVIQLDGKDHARLRKMVIAEFTVRRVEAMRDYVRTVVDGHLDTMLAQPGRADLVRDFASPITLLMISELLGVPPAYRRQFQSMSTTLLSSDATPEQTQQATAGLRDYLAELFADKQKNPREDLFSRMIVRGEADHHGWPSSVPRPAGGAHPAVPASTEPATRGAARSAGVQGQHAGVWRAPASDRLGLSHRQGLSLSARTPVLHR